MPMNNTSQNTNKYPHVIQRVMATVYQKIQVLYCTDKIRAPKGWIHILLESPSRDPEGNLTSEARKALIDVLKELTRTSGFRMCAVFGEQDAVYVEPDGQANHKNEPPSGGIQL